VNRWHFGRTWTSTIVPDLLGRMPRHPLLRANADTPTDHAGERDTLQGGGEPMGRAKPCGVQPNGGAPAQRAKQRGIKPAPAGAQLRPSSRRPR
jgi:hypothetical protein